MGLVGETLSAIPTTLAKVHGDGEGGGSRDNVDRGSSCKVETSKDEGPAVGVPGPAGDRVVDDGGPDEDEDKNGAKTATLSDGTDSEGSTRSRIIKR